MTAVNPMVTREQARDYLCPACGARPHQKCRALGSSSRGPRGAEIEGVHASRLAAARRAQAARRLGAP